MAECAIIGDLHGNSRWAISVLDFLGSKGITEVYQAGDFGVWEGPGGKAYLDDIFDACERNGIRLLVTPGNHEAYSMIEDPATDEVPSKQVLGSGDGWEVSLLPRGYTWTFGGMKFLSFGGAPSIDFLFRTAGKDWWPAEMIRDCDITRLKNIKGQIDVMISHDSPNGGTAAVEKICKTPQQESGWPIRALEYAAEGRVKMDEAVSIIDPRAFFHGHYHCADTRYDGDQDRLYVSLDMDGTNGNISILNTETGRVRVMGETEDNVL